MGKRRVHEGTKGVKIGKQQENFAVSMCRKLPRIPLLHRVG